MIDLYPGMRGQMNTGTPPVAGEDMGKGFRPGPHMDLTGKEHFTEQDVFDYASGTCGLPYDEMLHAAVAPHRWPRPRDDDREVRAERRQEPGGDRRAPRYAADRDPERLKRALYQCRIRRHDPLSAISGAGRIS